MRCISIVRSLYFRIFSALYPRERPGTHRMLYIYIILYYNIIILWAHRRICGPSLTETSACCAWLCEHTASKHVTHFIIFRIYIYLRFRLYVSLRCSFAKMTTQQHNNNNKKQHNNNNKNNNTTPPQQHNSNTTTKTQHNNNNNALKI